MERYVTVEKSSDTDKSTENNASFTFQFRVLVVCFSIYFYQSNFSSTSKYIQKFVSKLFHFIG